MSHQNFTNSHKQGVEALDQLQDPKDIKRLSKGKKVKKLWQKLFNQY